MNPSHPTETAATSGTLTCSKRARQHKIVGTDESVIPHTRRETNRCVGSIVAAGKCLTSETSVTAIGPSSAPNKQQAHSALASQLWVRLAFFGPPPPFSFGPPPPRAPCVAQRSSGHSDHATGDTNDTASRTVAVTSGIQKQSNSWHTSDGINTKSSAPMRT